MSHAALEVPPKHPTHDSFTLGICIHISKYDGLLTYLPELALN